ncbi:MAG: glycosyltransferase family 2 protein [Caulobacteraceae bacterium]
MDQQAEISSGPRRSGAAPDVSFVMPCLDETRSLAACIAAIREAETRIAASYVLTCEIVVADNGSTDGSQALAESLGARVVTVAEKGYGAALRGGFLAARGRYLVMGDADGSYDFREAVAMIGALVAGADLCIGSRFKGAIRPGAMPWKNRYVGNPLLTAMLNLLFNAKVSDAHCGLRAITRACFERLRLTGPGMEFASEMVIKAALKGEKIVERPATLSPDLRDRPPHLRPWRDGWRHLRYLFMLSPAWLFALPGALATIAGLFILASSGIHFLLARGSEFFFGNYWEVLASSLVGVGYVALLLALASHLHGVRSGYRKAPGWFVWLARWVNLESMILVGVGLVTLGGLDLVAVFAAWNRHVLTRADSVFPVVLGTLLMSLGAQTIFGGFLLAIIGGNEAQFIHLPGDEPEWSALPEPAPGLKLSAEPSRGHDASETDRHRLP